VLLAQLPGPDPSCHARLAFLFATPHIPLCGAPDNIHACGGGGGGAVSQAVLLSVVYNTFCDALMPGVGGAGSALAGVLSPRDSLLLPAALVVLQVVQTTY
jgi:hypothetical protein